ALVEGLAPDGLHVRGDDHWQSVTLQWGPGLSYTGALADFYRDCTVNLNSTSIQMAAAVNQRVFDCPGAGGFLLTDRQASLAALFDMDREVACYGSLAEAREQLRWFRERPLARREIALAAQRRILGEHTYRHRLETLAGWLSERYGG
ncbi:MAG: glycosyltransferase, partial [Gammaproteobacteria bacterium]|nr:glycosyltransferase [Gammaproteobacteria bacterium]